MAAARMQALRAALPGFLTSRSRAGDTALRVLSSTWTLGGIVFLVTWGGGLATPVPGSLDVSSHAGLNIAIERGLEHGRDIVFSYGPLGFLKTYYVFYEWPARLAALYGIALHLALSLSLVWAARRNFPLAVAFAVALVAAVLLRGDLSAAAVRDDAAVVVLAFIWCIAALGEDSPGWVRRLIVLGGGPFAAIELLAKLNTGVVVLALLAIAVLAIDDDRRRNVVMFSATFAGSLAVLWFATGQGLDNVGDYLGGARELVAGYSSGARLEFGSREYDYVLAPAVIAVAATIAWISAAGFEWRRRGAVLLMLALVAYASFKAGFVSHEVFHMATLYSTILGVCIAFRLPERPEIRYGVLAAIAGITVAAFTPRFDSYPLTDPIENVRNGVATLATLADPGGLEDEVAENRARMTAAYRLDPETFELLDGRTVHVDPSETAVAWAYDLDWRPLPVFQPYIAWTEDLDDQNARALASADGPELILRQNANPLGRYPGFESPAAMIAMLCHFRAVHTTDSWQVLERGDDRCGEPRPLGTAEGTYGTPIPVPRAPRGEVVFARVDGVEVSGLERLRAFLLRARGRQVSFDGGDPYVFIAATAGDGLLLRAAPDIDFPAPYELAPNADEITFLLDRGASDDPITVDFYSMPVRPSTVSKPSGPEAEGQR